MVILLMIFGCLRMLIMLVIKLDVIKVGISGIKIFVSLCNVLFIGVLYFVFVLDLVCVIVLFGFILFVVICMCIVLIICVVFFGLMIS